ncbi:MAG: hypothetical protein ACPKM0_05650 [Pleomorphochaeta sp.]
MRKYLLLVCLLLLLFTSCLEQEEKELISDDTIILRYAESEKEDSYLAQISTYFASLVEEESEGKIIIKVYYGGELGTEEEVLTQLQFGGIALGRVNFLSVSEQLPSFITSYSHLIDLPFFNFLNTIDSNENYNFAFQNEKLYPLSVLPPSKRCIYSDEEIDIENYGKIKIGIDNSKMYEKYLMEIGLSPIIIGNIDTFPSLRNGFIDARESSLSSFLTSDEYPYIKEVLLLDDITLPSFILFSNEILNQLSRDEVNILLKCAEQTLEYSKKYISKEESNAIIKVENEKNVRVM